MTLHRIKKIIVHWSASSKSTTVEDIRNWHVKGNGWRDIGYHRVILFPGEREVIPGNLIKQGRQLDNDLYLSDLEVGAQCKGMNTESVGICVIGNKDYPLHPLQKRALHLCLDVFVNRFELKSIDVYGHRDFYLTECPGAEIYGLVQKYRAGTWDEK